MSKVSVVMPMYNGLPYVGEAIESIISQTFQDWELLVIDDASTDGSPHIVRQYCAKDTRVKLIENESDLHGPGPARNIGIDNAAGEYVAMMDADDISLPRRLELQVRFMDTHPNVAMSGCYAKCFGESNRILTAPRSDRAIKALLFFRKEFVQPAVIFRRETIKEKYPATASAEDVHFCIAAALKYKAANLPKILYRYRVHDDSITFHIDGAENYKRVCTELLPLCLGFVPTPDQVTTHVAWTHDLREISTLAKLRWILYALIHGKYTWHDRLILGSWCIIRTSLRKFYLTW